MKTFAITIALLLGLPVVAVAGDTLHIHMISGSKEYKSEPSLKAFSKYLEETYDVKCTASWGRDGKKQTLENLDQLDDADLLLLFSRRMKLPEEQTEKIKDWCEAGKPVLGIRTASHGIQTWLKLDKLVLGGDYSGHGGGEEVAVTVNEKARDHAILEGIEGWTRKGKMYRNPELAADVTVLLIGKGAKSGDTQPLAWCYEYKIEKPGRSFYTGMGYAHDFDDARFKRLLVNAIEWTTKTELKAASEAAEKSESK